MGILIIMIDRIIFLMGFIIMVGIIVMDYTTMAIEYLDMDITTIEETDITMVDAIKHIMADMVTIVITIIINIQVITKKWLEIEIDV